MDEEEGISDDRRGREREEERESDEGAAFCRFGARDADEASGGSDVDAELCWICCDDSESVFCSCSESSSDP